MQFLLALDTSRLLLSIVTPCKQMSQLHTSYTLRKDMWYYPRGSSVPSLSHVPQIMVWVQHISVKSAPPTQTRMHLILPCGPACTCFFTVSHNSCSTSLKERAKVREVLYGCSVHPLHVIVSVCVLSSKTIHSLHGPSEGYPNRPQYFPQAAPSVEEQLWPLLVTL